jgi:DNA mismatch repair ATPase MutS
VILDEIGRGTSTFDGLSIAWAVAEHMATNPKARPKTLFATHYHELTDLADAVPGVVNAHVAAREWKDDIIFLRKIIPGRSDRSYGIQVARLAGLPPKVVARAKAILAGLERDELSRGGRPTLSGSTGDMQSSQLGLFAAPVDAGGPEGLPLRGPNLRGSVDADRRSVVDADLHASQMQEGASAQAMARRLREIDVDGTTPRQALDLLAELKKLADG